MYKWTCALWVILFLLVNSQAKTQDVYALFSEADELIKNRQFSEAQSILGEVESICGSNNKTDLLLWAVCFKAYCDYELADYRSMHELSLKAESIFNEWSNRDSTVLATIEYMLGLSYYELGNINIANQYYKSSFEHIQEYTIFGFREEDLFHNLALCYLDGADYEKVRLYINLALQSDSPEINTGDLAQWNHIIALSYQYQKDYEKAEEYYNRAILDLENVKALERIDYPLIILNSYASYLLQIDSLNKAERIIEDIENLGPNKANYINYKQLTAKLALKKNDQQSALALFTEVIDTAISYYGEHKIDVIETYLDIAEAYYDHSNFQEALPFVQKSLDANILHSNSSSEEMKSQKYYIPKLALEAFLIKSKCLAKTNYLESVSVNNLLLDLLQDIIDNDLSLYESKLHMVHYVRDYFEELIQLAMDHDDVEGAFYLCQQSHGLVLDLQINEHEIKADVLEPGLLQRDLTWRKDITKLKSDLYSINQSEDKELEKQTREKLFNLQYEYDQFTDSLFTQFPQLKNETGNSKHTIETIRSKLLEKNSILIEYFLTSNMLYSFTIEHDTVFAIEQQIPENFDSLIIKLLNCTSTFKTNQFDDFVNASFHLYELLLEPILSNVSTDSKLFIIPDGTLNYISFDALIDSVPANLANNRYDLLNYLIKNYETNYNYSSLLYEFNDVYKVQNLAGFAPSFSSALSEKENLSPLLHNMEEVLKIDDIIDGEMYVDTTARLEYFMDSINQYNIIHFATHAICNDSLPMKSKIYFYEDQLNVYELYNLTHSINLAVLSACNTGSGTLRNGEGIMSLARAFMASGCSSIITSLWNVNDRVSVDIVTKFYQSLAEGKKIGHALRAAKLNYLNQSNSIMDAHPYYWSGLILIGDDAHFFEHGNSNKFYIVATLIIIIALFILYRKKTS